MKTQQPRTIELLDGEIMDRQELAKEVARRVYNEVEWHFERFGEIPAEWETFDAVNQEMKNEKYIDEACDVFDQDADAAFEEAVDDLEFSLRHANCPDPGAGTIFFDKHI